MTKSIRFDNGMFTLHGLLDRGGRPRARGRQGAARQRPGRPRRPPAASSSPSSPLHLHLRPRGRRPRPRLRLRHRPPRPLPSASLLRLPPLSPRLGLGREHPRPPAAPLFPAAAERRCSGCDGGGVVGIGRDLSLRVPRKAGRPLPFERVRRRRRRWRGRWSLPGPADLRGAAGAGRGWGRGWGGGGGGRGGLCYSGEAAGACRVSVAGPTAKSLLFPLALPFSRRAGARGGRRLLRPPREGP